MFLLVLKILSYIDLQKDNKAIFERIKLSKKINKKITTKNYNSKDCLYSCISWKFLHLHNILHFVRRKEAITTSFVVDAL